MANGKTEVEDISSLREEIERQRRELDSLVDRFKEGAGELGAEAYERMRDTTSKARERTKDTVQVVGHKIEERPFTSLIITFVVGLVLGVLFAAAGNQAAASVVCIGLMRWGATLSVAQLAWKTHR